MNKTYGYLRVSTREQNLIRQIDALLARDIVIDKASGKDYGQWKSGKITAVCAMDLTRLKRSTIYK